MVSQEPANDATGDRNDVLSKLKFRAGLSIVGAYLPRNHDGVKTAGHFQGNDYTPLDYTDEDDKHHSKGDRGRVISGGIGGLQAKLYANYSVIAPLFNFDNPLTSTNNIKFTLNYEISPITTNIGATVAITPAAFLVLSGGFLIGSGWQITGTMAGIGLNDNGVIKRYGFTAPHLQLWFTTTFQMDTAFVLPKTMQRWTHFVVLGNATFKYQGLLGVSDYQPYMYEECYGEQLGGWRFLVDGLVGYRIYIKEDPDFDSGMFIKRDNQNFIVTIGAYVWMDYLNLTHYYDSPMKSGGWGSDFAYVSFGPVMQIDLPYNVYFKFFALFRNDKAYSSGTVGNADFRDRVYEDYNIFFRWVGVFIGINL